MMIIEGFSRPGPCIPYIYIKVLNFLNKEEEDMLHSFVFTKREKRFVELEEEWTYRQWMYQQSNNLTP